MKSVRVVVTGLGAVSPLGLNVEEMWAGLRAGRCGIGPIKAFDPTGLPCRFAGEVPEYRIQNYVPRSHRKAVKLMCRDIELAVVAAQEAIAASGLITKGIDPEKINVDPTRMAITLGAGMISADMVELAPATVASVSDGQFDIQKWGRLGLEQVTPVWLLKYLPNMLACHIGIIHDIRGPSNSITCAEASGPLAIGEAAQVIARGDSEVALAGGAEAKVNPFIMVRQCLLKRIADDAGQSPETVCRPFDAGATGAVFGEGAGVLVLENLEHAQQRNATISAEVAGIGQSQNLSPVYDRLEADGKGLQIAIEKALDDAEISPAELDLIIPHGTGVPGDDLAEARAIEAALGSAVEDVTVWPTKSMLSTTGAASGALDLIAAIQAMSTGVIPAARNFEAAPDGCHLRIPVQDEKREIRYALSCSYTHGGQTAAVVIRRYDESTTA
ncbi:MAG: beta-ketoacyl-[acyl-carrier-protein] synthase family protein [Phycisphaerales bacterium]|nr:MAG: beta-ketoacyl-[acyl-carrier-protein] synthase family protein [Phycisphaerales bacterium]